MRSQYNYKVNGYRACIAIILFLVIYYAIGTLILLAGWNIVIVNLFGAPTASPLEAFVAAILLSFLFGMIRGGSK